MNLLLKVFSRLHRMYMAAVVDRQKKTLKCCGNDVNLNYYSTIIGPNGLEIGDHVLIAEYTSIFAGYGVKIGDHTMISSGCCISSINHELSSRNRYSSQEGDSAPVVIGKNVWLGMNVVVLPGVSIGDNSIIGAGSVLTRSVPSNEIWVGNPAKFVKKIEVNE